MRFSYLSQVERVNELERRRRLVVDVLNSSTLSSKVNCSYVVRRTIFIEHRGQVKW